jgi:hypothetical protein
MGLFNWLRGKPLKPEAAAWQHTLPEPPEGYSWEHASHAKAFFLRPHGWHFRGVEQPPLFDYFITKEQMPPDSKDAGKLFSDLAIRAMEQGQYLIRHGSPTQFETVSL